MLSVTEAVDKVAALELAHPCLIGIDWPATDAAALRGVVELIDLPAAQGQQTGFPRSSSRS